MTKGLVALSSRWKKARPAREKRVLKTLMRKHIAAAGISPMKRKHRQANAEGFALRSGH